ncbi:D-cysteine desulfhydrase family protein [Thermomicrobium sp. 4228-Ro]|uniref:D-cysteine desulfhydrase family protein n=1 Tax=Thermomicrobium sp. 4228-Ro TaxID=2993937 RepID=UPI002248829B|nr:D-cysteine desulfhydrase family protein [Thermomicrobium sp. 4228-Ro]MCX2727120.1 D-cysteine desulfhydrase family protein [Thermomicrobium sp. 4228-Ro]
MRLLDLPRYPLAQLPTPLEEAPRLSAALGSFRILVKRDDLTGVALGGNKTRKLEYLLGDALAHGATVILTEGPVQSNHCRQTAAVAARAGLRCVLVLSSAEERPSPQGNLLLDHLFGPEIHLVRTREERARLLEQLAQERAERGERPYVIPTGGSTPVGAAAYVRAALELVQQLVERQVHPTRLFLASSTSGGTHAGLALGTKLLGDPFRIVGVAVEHDAATIRERVVALANETAATLGLAVRLAPADVLVDDRWIGPDYGVPDASTIEAMTLAARTEGLVLDPVYTGKALAGLIGHARAGEIEPGETVIFLHTGGAPALFAQAGELAHFFAAGDTVAS